MRPVKRYLEPLVVPRIILMAQLWLQKHSQTEYLPIFDTKRKVLIRLSPPSADFF